MVVYPGGIASHGGYVPRVYLAYHGGYVPRVYLASHGGYT